MIENIQILLDALAAETARASGRATAPLSVSFEFLPREPKGALTARVNIDRATRTLVFATADLLDSDGERVLAATAVHKITS